MRKIAIAGAGVAGLASAILLKRAGYAVQVFDQVADPTPVGAGLLLQPSGQAVLKKLGLLEQVRAQAAVIECLQGYSGNWCTLDLHYAALGQDWHGLGIHRASLHNILWQAASASGVELHLGTALHTFQIQADSVQLNLAQGAAQFDALIIANGTRSQLREQLPISQSYRPYPWGAYWAVLDSDDWPHIASLKQRYRGAHQLLGILPTGRNPLTGRRCYSLFWSLPRSEFAQLQQQGIEPLIGKIRLLWPEVADWFASAAETKIAIADYADVRLQNLQHENVLVIGDAAHAMSPQLGQGANMALIDAYILAQSLQANDNIKQAFQQFTQRRAKHIAYYQFASRIMTPLYQSHYPIAWLRDAGTVLGRHIGPVYRQYLLTLCGAKQGIWDFKAGIDELLDLN